MRKYYKLTETKLKITPKILNILHNEQEKYVKKNLFQLNKEQPNHAIKVIAIVFICLSKLLITFLFCFPFRKKETKSS